MAQRLNVCFACRRCWGESPESTIKGSLIERVGNTPARETADQSIKKSGLNELLIRLAIKQLPMIKTT